MLKKNIFFGLIVLLFATNSLFSQTKKDSLTWFTDFNKAKEVATQKGLPIFADFTGSDWCIWCVRLEKNILSQKDFIKYAKKNLVLLKLDFPRNKPQSRKEKAANNRLAVKYGIRGYPTVLILDAKGKALGRTGYKNMTPAQYVEHLKAFVK